jgi:hypothetical protein
MWRQIRPRIPNILSMKKNKIGGLGLSSFKTYYKAVVIMIVIMIGGKGPNRQRDQGDGIERPETDPHKHSQ